MVYSLITILFIITLVLFFLFKLMLKSFLNKERIHRKNPADIGIPFEEISIPTKNNCKLYGWLIKVDTGFPTLVMMHGWGRNVERVLPYIRQLNSKDYNLLAFDSRHHGSSDKDDFSTMVKFAEDISASVDFVVENEYFKNPSIGVIGLSIGGAASIYAAAHDERIKSVVTVGAFADPMDIMKLQLMQHHIPYIPIGWMVLQYIQKQVGFKFTDVAPEKHMKNSSAEFLLIHGDEDVKIPLSHFHRLIESSDRGKVSSWEIAGRGHSDCHLEDGFWLKIKDHFDRTLKD